MKRRNFFKKSFGSAIAAFFGSKEAGGVVVKGEWSKMPIDQLVVPDLKRGGLIKNPTLGNRLDGIRILTNGQHVGNVSGVKLPNGKVIENDDGYEMTITFESFIDL